MELKKEHNSYNENKKLINKDNSTFIKNAIETRNKNIVLTIKLLKSRASFILDNKDSNIFSDEEIDKAKDTVGIFDAVMCKYTDKC